MNPREWPQSAGKIYPPWAVIEYGEITQEQLKNGAEIEFEFKVDYSMDPYNTEKDIEVRGFILRQLLSLLKGKRIKYLDSE